MQPLVKALAGILQHVFQIHHADVIRLQDVRKPGEGPGHAVLFNDAVEGFGLVFAVLLAAQHAIPAKGHGNQGAALRYRRAQVRRSHHLEGRSLLIGGRLTGVFGFCFHFRLFFSHMRDGVLHQRVLHRLRRLLAFQAQVVFRRQHQQLGIARQVGVQPPGVQILFV